MRELFIVLLCVSAFFIVGCSQMMDDLEKIDSLPGDSESSPGQGDTTDSESESESDPPDTEISTGSTTEIACDDGCLIEGVCHDEGSTKEDDVCLVCEVANSSEQWSFNDGQSCGTNKQCQVGLCECEAGWLGADCDQCIRYVDLAATGNGDGLSWENSYTRVQDAVDAADVPNCQVWVAQGTYLPTYQSDTDDDRSYTFLMKEGVHIYGGFEGDETSIDERSVSGFATVLSGNMGDSASLEDNAHHVVTGADSAGLDGFTVKDGNANSSDLNAFGGGVYIDGSSPVIKNCKITDNHAINGAALWAAASEATLVNLVVSGNASDQEGAGAGFIDFTGEIINCTFYGNTTSAVSGSALWITATDDASVMHITNSIVWGNLPQKDSVLLDNMSHVSVTYSNIQEAPDTDEDELFKLHGNLNSDPMFVDAVGGDLSLGPWSPCVDAASSNAAPTADMVNNSRYDDYVRPNAGVGSIKYVDMGAYEYQHPSPHSCIYRVDARVSTAGDGSGWGEGAAMKDLQTAINEAATVANGTDQVCEVWVVNNATPYVPTVGSDESDPRTVSFSLKTGVAVFGGFAGNETTFEQRSLEGSAKTILSGELGDTASEEDNALNVVSGGNYSHLDGFIITAGYNRPTDSVTILPAGTGSGLLASGVNMSISNCSFENNNANSGALMLYGSNALVTNCVFTDNEAAAGTALVANSGTFSLENTVPRSNIRNCRFENNEATSNNGGAVSINVAITHFDSCIFRGNKISGVSGVLKGGALRVSGADFSAANCLFAGNDADAGGLGGSSGGAAYISAQDQTVIFNNCTFASNVSGVGSSLYFENTDFITNFQLVNNVFWNIGSVSEIVLESIGAGFNTDISYNNIKDGCANVCGSLCTCPGTNVASTVDPFVDYMNGDFNLNIDMEGGGLCIDSADGDRAPSFDIVDFPRVDFINISNGGVGTPVYVDMGAFELQ